jgi:hypothetical protein
MSTQRSRPIRRIPITTSITAIDRIADPGAVDRHVRHRTRSRPVIRGSPACARIAAAYSFRLTRSQGGRLAQDSTAGNCL